MIHEYLTAKPPLRSKLTYFPHTHLKRKCKNTQFYNKKSFKFTRNSKLNYSSDKMHFKKIIIFSRNAVDSSIISHVYNQINTKKI